jgi:hypothetical protein
MALQYSKWFEDSEVRTCAKPGLSSPRAVAEKTIALGLAITQDSDRHFRLGQIDRRGLRPCP